VNAAAISFQPLPSGECAVDEVAGHAPVLRFMDESHRYAGGVAMLDPCSAESRSLLSRPIARCALALLGLTFLAAPRATAQILGSEIVFVRQTQVNDRPYFEIRRKTVNGTTDQRLFGGCVGGIRAPYCAYANPVISPDGRRLAFVFEPVSEEACKSIWISDLAGRNARQISPGCSVASPTWSPDGSTIAYASDNAIYEVELCRNQLPETGPRRVTTGHSPSYSRDGRWIAFARNGDIFKTPSSSSRLTLPEVNLTRHASADRDPRWTKSGSTGDFIVFLSNRDGAGDVYIMDANGQNLRRITTSATPKSTPDLAILPSAFTWQEGTSVMFKAGGIAPRSLGSGKQPYFGGVANKVKICP
jgi:hypothetical protein